MRLLIDANILLDVLQNRERFVKESSIIWKLCETERAEGYFTTLTFANLVYIMRKEMDPERIAQVVRALALIFKSADFTSSDMVHAAEIGWNDYEDAVQSVIAERIHADYIITRNVKDFLKSKVMALTPGELIARL